MALGIGDDMAVVSSKRAYFLISCDMILDGIHFETGKHELALIGRKALCCGLSDCAAMAVRPTGATVGVAVPADFENCDAEELFDGILRAAREFDVAILGGDTTRWDHPLAIDVAVTAEPWEGVDPVTRSGAKPGDRLYVTGKLGGSAAGRHLNFPPRIHEAKAIAQKLGPRIHALMDISDGLSLDLWRMCRSSGVGATLEEVRLERVISDDAVHAAADDGRSPLAHALEDGEDFELLLAAESAADVDELDIREIGVIIQSGFNLRDAKGRVVPMDPRGYVH